MNELFRFLLLTGLVVCAAATALVKKPMRAVIIYMAYSIIMSVVWLLLESPDLAITEAAVEPELHQGGLRGCRHGGPPLCGPHAPRPCQ